MIYNTHAMQRRIGIMGPVGSGKSTQAKIIAEKLGLCWVSTGELARQQAQEDSDLGRKFKQLLDEGQLIDDPDIAELLRVKLAQTECQTGFVLDGYPRDLPQASFFDPHFEKVFFLKMTEAEVIKRLLLRGRFDDTPELIKTRLQIYHQLTEPVLDYYRNQGCLVEVDGDRSIEEVAAEIAQHL